MLSFPIEQAHTRLRELIDAAIAGENDDLKTTSRDAGRLVPVSTNQGHSVFGSARGLIAISKDLDEPLDDFRDYMDAAQ